MWHRREGCILHGPWPGVFSDGRRNVSEGANKHRRLPVIPAADRRLRTIIV